MTPRELVLLGEVCRYCKQPLDGDLPGPRTCGDCREELRGLREDERERPEREDDE